MAIVFDLGIDTTLDLAWEDAKNVVALPFKKGLHRKTANEGQALFQYLKTDAKFFKDEVFGGKNFDNHCGFTYVGDAWLEHLDWGFVSDWYKDAYGQRPHFLREWFAKMCELPFSADTSMFFCKDVDSWLEEARMAREEFCNN